MTLTEPLGRTVYIPFDLLLGDSEDVVETEDKPEVAGEDETKAQDEDTAEQPGEDTAEQPETIAEQPEESEVTDQIDEQ
jgi:hypothetical protein